MVAILGLVAAEAAAEPLDPHFYIAPLAGYSFFERDMRAPSNRPLEDHFSFGGVIGYQATRWLGIELSGSFTPTREDAPSPLDVDWTQGSGNLALTPWSGRHGGAFLLIGAGAGRLKPSGGGDHNNQLNADVGAGAHLWLGDLAGVRVEARDLIWLPRKDVTDPKAHTLVVRGGLVFALGATPRDGDQDGVPDRRDKCPGTLAGAVVDALGCTQDGDNDGVVDGIDQCPGSPAGATVDARGCTQDSDGDGVVDGVDQCADTPKGGTVDPRGCPTDADEDGVVDGIDQCASTPKGATVDERGCPTDSDNDGVVDGIDACPGTSPGLRVDASGCPIEVIEKETELLDTGMIRLQDVNFETGKSDILPESMPSLDIVGQVLTKWPDLRVEIGGHTDARGSNAYNQRLSESRVGSVLDYLIARYPTLKREQFEVKGYGESKPLVPNNSALNMAKNRRVEFKVLNTEVLKREIERRKLLKSD
jgi:outer membrane protein OmpA-like peptidoglycan-associated protein